VAKITTHAEPCNRRETISRTAGTTVASGESSNSLGQFQDGFVLIGCNGGLSSGEAFFDCRRSSATSGDESMGIPPPTSMNGRNSVGAASGEGSMCPEGSLSVGNTGARPTGSGEDCSRCQSRAMILQCWTAPAWFLRQIGYAPWVRFPESLLTNSRRCSC
jgi:hypothetical protein